MNEVINTTDVSNIDVNTDISNYDVNQEISINKLGLPLSYFNEALIFLVSTIPYLLIWHFYKSIWIIGEGILWVFVFITYVGLRYYNVNKLSKFIIPIKIEKNSIYFPKILFRKKQDIYLQFSEIKNIVFLDLPRGSKPKLMEDAYFKIIITDIYNRKISLNTFMFDMITFHKIIKKKCPNIEYKLYYRIYYLSFVILVLFLIYNIIF